MKQILIKEQDGMWHLSGTFMGVRVRRTTGLPAQKNYLVEAQKIKTFVEMEIINGTYGPRQPNRTVFAAVNDYISLHHGKMKGGYNVLRDFATKHGHMMMSSVSSSLVQKYVEDQFRNDNQEGWRVKASTLHTETGPLRRLCTIEYEAGHMKRPVKLALPQRGDGRSVYLTVEQATAVVDNEPKQCAPIFSFLLTSGARFMEAMRLEWADVNLDEGWVILTTYKGNNTLAKKRKVPIPKTTVDKLAALPHRAGRVFLNAHGRPYKMDAANAVVGRYWTELRKTLGCPEITLHDFRHTYASHLAMQGVDLRRLADLLGHTNLNQTRRYAHLLPSVMQDAVARLPYGQEKAA